MVLTMEPASTIIERLGGPTAVARKLGVHRVTVSKWKRSRKAGGTGGSIPQRHHRAILKAAKEANAPISADDLLAGEFE